MNKWVYPQLTRMRKRRLEAEEAEFEALKLQSLQRESGLSGRVLSQTEQTL